MPPLRQSIRLNPAALAGRSGFIGLTVTFGSILLFLHACMEPLTRDSVLIRPGSIVTIGTPSVTSVVARTVANPVRVRVLDTEGFAMPDRSVRFTVSGGTVIPETVKTNDNGEAQVTSWTMPTLSGSATLTATVVKLDDQDLQPSVNVVAAVSPDIADTVVVQVASPSAAVNSTVAITVAVRDQYNNGIQGARLSLQLGESPTNAAILSANPATTGASGSANVSWRLDTLARANTLLISTLDAPVQSNTATVTGTAAAAAQITSVSTRNQPGLPSTAVASVPEVLVQDQYGNNVASTNVTFQVTTGGGTVTASAGTCSSSTICQVPTGTDGRAKVSTWTLGAGLGTHTLSAVAASGATSIALTPGFTADATRDLRVTALTVPASGAVGDSISVVAAIMNQGNVPAGAFSVSFRFSSNNTISTSDPLSPSSCAVASLAGGATFNCSLKIAIPGSVTAANWFVGVVADEANVIEETDETNNTFVSTATVTITPPAPPAAPSGLTSTSVGTRHITLAWTDNSTVESSYRIERCFGIGCTGFFEVASRSANTTTYSDSSLSSGSTYRYRVRAGGAGGFSTYSNIVTAATLSSGRDLQVTAVTSPATAILGDSISITSTVINLGDTATAGFRIGVYLSTNNFISLSDTYSGVSCTVASLASTATTNCNVKIRVPTTLTPATYWVGVYADDLSQVTESDESNNSLPADSIIINPPAPAAPTNLAVTLPSSTQANLAWSDNSTNEDGFRIERCSGAGCTNFTEIKTVSTNVVATSDTTLVPNTTYSYRVRAYNGGGNSGYTSVVSVTTPDTPLPPSALTANGTSTSQINLAWTDNSNNETGFRIERCSGSGCTVFTEIATVAANVVTYSNTSLAAGTSYSYRVRAYKGTENSAYTSTATAVTALALVNGDFTSGVASWTFSGNASASTTLTGYRTATGYAFLATDASSNGLNFAFGTMYQTIAVPSAATSATLGFWYCITTTETGTTATDNLTVTVQNSAGSTLATVVTRSNLSAVSSCGTANPDATNRGYTQVTFDLKPHAGQLIRIYFQGTSNGTNPTVFRIDDVAVTWSP